MAGEENYGYTPPHQGPMAQYDTYVKPGSIDQASEEFGQSQRPTVDKDGNSHDNEADVDYAPIEKLYSMMGYESDELTRGMARLWGDISTLLEFTRTNMKAHADALAEKWNSQAARSFLLHVGAALYSLDEWKKAADENSSGLYALAGQVETSSKEVQRIWDDYKREFSAAKADHEDSTTGDKIKGFFGVDDAEDLNDLKKRFADSMRPHVQAVASTYLDTIFYKMGGGTKYKGPLDAAVTFPGQAPGRPGMPARPGTPPARPGGTRPTAPNRPDLQDQPERPDRPEQPDVPDRPDMPNRPDGLELAGGVTTPPPPPPQVTIPGGGPGGGPAPAPPPTSPLLPSTGGPGNRPGNPGLRAGNAPTRPSAPPQFPGTGGGRGASGPRPGMPQLPGRGGQNARPSAPGRPGAPTPPQLPGRGQTARPGAPKTAGKGGTPTTPQLPGRGASGTRPGTPKGNQPPATPPNLAGRGGGAGARPGPARPAPAIGDQQRTPTAGGPDLPDQHGVPQARGSAGLGGRRQPTAPGAGGAEPDVRPALGGRAGTSPTSQDPFTGTAGAQHRRPQANNPEEDLWAVDEAAPSVIEKPADVQDERRDPGPTLGMSR
jgi:hypothetical protein